MTEAPSGHNWKIVRADDHGQVNKVQLDRLTVFFNGRRKTRLASLDESRLDEALLRLFGLATGTKTETPTVRDERPIHLSTPVAASLPTVSEIFFTRKPQREETALLKPCYCAVRQISQPTRTSYDRKLWIGCRSEKGAVLFRGAGD